MGRKYFGTDGIRGKIGRYPMTPDFVLKLGWAAGKVLASNGHPLVLIGKDTRISGYMLGVSFASRIGGCRCQYRLLDRCQRPQLLI